MFLLTMPALKKIISTFVYPTDVEPPIACVNPIVFTTSLALPILLFTFGVSIIVFYFFCG